jgi:uncharacterized protein YjlB
VSTRSFPRRCFLSLVAAASGSVASAASSDSVAATPQPRVLRFEDTGEFPNSRLPVLVYPGALRGGDLAEAFERRFDAHGWRPAWRAGLYDFHHYHSTSHEALGVFGGRASVRLGGPQGELVHLSAGDLLVLPAGVAHKNEEHSSGFAVVGAYPRGSSWDMQYGKSGERPRADRNISRAGFPGADPLHGAGGPLSRLWLRE